MKYTGSRNRRTQNVKPESTIGNSYGGYYTLNGLQVFPESIENPLCPKIEMFSLIYFLHGSFYAEISLNLKVAMIWLQETVK